MIRSVRLLVFAWAVQAGGFAEARTAHPHKPIVRNNLIIFVADGLRSGVVDAATAPALAALRRDGVDLRNSHSVYPTLTTANASAIATGHQLGDTGDFANSIYVGFAVPSAGGSSTPFLENDAVLGDVNDHFGGDYLAETSLLAAASAAGFSTAAVGKLGPTAIQDVTARSGTGTIVLDDRTGSAGGLPVATDVANAIAAAGLANAAPSRGANGNPGDAAKPGTLVANVAQQQWFVDVTTRVLLPRFKQAGKPFALVFWSRDPDGSQHNQGDSLNTLTPGINGPTSMAAIRNVDGNLAALRAALKALGLDQTTNIIVTADHGFSTISRQSATSGATRHNYPGVPQGLLPPGFLAVDLAEDLGLPLTDADSGRPVDAGAGQHPVAGNGLIGADPAHPQVVVAANGGTDLIYLPGPDATALAARIVGTLAHQDYVSSIFVDDALGRVAGTLPLSAIGLRGSARTPRPSIVVGFASHPTGCAIAELCSAQVSDTTLQQGQGMHGSFSRADTHNFMAAIGPDFKRRFVDTAPVGNADVGATAARLLGLRIAPKGRLTGRVMSEALAGGAIQKGSAQCLVSSRSSTGFMTILRTQRLGGTTYYDVAGRPGHTVGLNAVCSNASVTRSR